jgi:ABC-type hemin transport system substrate-binding protein
MPSVRLTWLTAALAATLVGCESRTEPRAGIAAAPAAGARIVSLSPALTHASQALGAGGSVVGRTPWCRAEQAAVVGTFEDRNLEAIAALRPTLILRQSSVADAALDRSAPDARRFDCTLSSLDDVRAMVPALADALAAQGIGGAPLAAARIATEHAAAMAVPLRTRGPVLFLFGTDPPAAFGQGTFVDGLWTGMGGTNAVRQSGYPELSAEDVVGLRPVAVVVVGTATVPAWLRDAVMVVPLDAACLLEPSTAMLVEGPRALASADAAIAARAGAP